MACPYLRRESRWTILKFSVYSRDQISLFWLSQNCTRPTIDLIFFDFIVSNQSFFNLSNSVANSAYLLRELTENANRPRELTHEEIMIAAQLLDHGLRFTQI